MSSIQLRALVATKGPLFTVKGKAFKVEGISSHEDIAVGTFKTKRATYTGVRCNNTRVVGSPGAEVWSILAGNGRQVTCFAVYQGAIKELAA
ncbi:MAG: hypothetical protein A2286_00025 [Gammaproteobacteria bacterium RIFOXYA12_FULL_61_12]|nr:MAG: hypothetical protein A2514_11450 [Gammaproteobacteria bacterium RIFOXYD12_FULL_61_37]OGT90754.1 MAG: hypothetical protein A2286_00025 [Gammaproteobacteria bacterium RIFOXYA12_FULL_61_12]